MLHIVTEDTNSAGAFWDCVAKTFRGESNYRLVPLLKDNILSWNICTVN